MNHSNDPQQTSSRKKDHVELVVGKDVVFRGKTTGLERYEFMHNALPELDFAEVTTETEFLGKSCGMPLIISSMTGGYADARHINEHLAEVCESLRIPMGVGSMRQALSDDTYHESFRVARRTAPSVPIFGNIGAAEIVHNGNIEAVRRLADLIEADGFAVHLNPLQELMQPEGTPAFRGVLAGIERLVRDLGIPIIVKEVGAGLSSQVVGRLLDAGVRIIDVSGAGGTSWSGVELLRRTDGEADDMFWDWGIPTADAIIAARPLCDRYNATLIGSGGIAAPRDAAVAIALGSHLAAAARPFLKTLVESGQPALSTLLEDWRDKLRKIMFLTGAGTVEEMRSGECVVRGTF